MYRISSLKQFCYGIGFVHVKEFYDGHHKYPIQFINVFTKVLCVITRAAINGIEDSDIVHIFDASH